MDAAFFREVVQLGGTVVTVVIFIWYLDKRDRAIQSTLVALGEVIHELKGRMFNTSYDEEKARAARRENHDRS